MKPVALPCLFLLFSLAGCNSDALINESRKMDNGQWAYEETVQFDVHVTNTEKPYNFYALVRNGTTYGFSNLLLFFHTKFPDGSIRLDTVSCPLADPGGRWYGSGLGDMVDNEILFKRNVQFRDTGNYVFEFQHAMRQDTVEEIYDIGLRIEAAN